MPSSDFGMLVYDWEEVSIFYHFYDTCVNVTIKYRYSYNNQINARAVIGQSAVGYCAGKPTEKSRVLELLYKSNRPQVSVVYKLINPLGCW